MRRIAAVLLVAGCGGAGASDPNPCTATEGGFVDCTPGSGIDIGPVAWTAQIQAWTGGAVADVDGDDLPDLVTWTVAGEAILWRNLGGFRFEEAQRFGRGVSGAKFGDLDGDGDQDLVTAPGIERALQPEEPPKQELRVWRNDGGRFVDVSEAWGFGVWVSDRFAFLRSVAIVDVNRDGVPDVLGWCQLADVPPVLFLSDGGGWSRSSALDRWTGSAWASMLVGDRLWLIYDGAEIASPARALVRQGERWREDSAAAPDLFGDGASVRSLMSAAALDFDGDGDLDLYVTDTGDQHLLEDRAGAWVDVAPDVGAAANPNPLGGLGVAFDIGTEDVDRDGWPDLFVTSTPKQSFAVTPHPMLLRNTGGQFEDRSAWLGIDGPHAIGGVSAADFDRDGRVDYFLHGVNEPPMLLRNALPGGPSVSVEAETGSVVTVEDSHGRTQVRRVGEGNPFGQSEQRATFGLGGAEVLRIRIITPDGAERVN